MDLSALMPLLLAQSGGKGDSNNNMMNMLPHLMSMQKGGGDMSEILKMMSGTTQKKEPEPQPKPKQESEDTRIREQAYDTNPQYLTRYYDAGNNQERIKPGNNTYTDSTAESDEKKSSRQQLDEMLGDYRSKGGKINDSPKDNMQAKLMAEMMSGGEINPMTLMQLMGNGGKDGFNPMMLMPLMQSLGKKKEGNVSAAAANPNALLTKPIEPVAPSQIVLNIRKYLSK